MSEKGSGDQKKRALMLVVGVLSGAYLLIQILFNGEWDILPRACACFLMIALGSGLLKNKS